MNNDKAISQDPYTLAQAYSWDGFYKFETTGKSILYKQRLALAIELLDKHIRPNGGAVADIGCGAGQLSAELLQRGFNVTALDYSQQMLHVARNNLATVTPGAKGAVSFICADLNEYDIAEASYSAICALGCVEFLNDVPRAISNLGVGVSLGGHLLVSMPNVISPLVFPEKIARMLLQHQSYKKRPSSHHPLSLKKVSQILGEKGFVLSDVRYSVPATLVGPIAVPPAFMMRYFAKVRSYPFAPWLANTWVALFCKEMSQP